jgi:hypothetical protein
LALRKKQRERFKFLIQAVWNVAQFQLVKRDFRKSIVAFIFRIEQWEYNGIPFTKIGKFVFVIRY